MEAMKRFTMTAAGMVCCLLAGGAQAQGFLEGLARRAAAATTREAVDGLRGAAPPDAGRDGPPAASTPARARPARPLGRRDDAPEAEGMQGLSEEDRFRACSARYPTEGLTGDAWMQRATQHRLCMGPAWGEGG